MDTVRVLDLYLIPAGRLGAVREVAALTPSPSSPALESRPDPRIVRVCLDGDATGVCREHCVTVHS
jgi:hypothetical protein